VSLESSVLVTAYSYIMFTLSDSVIGIIGMTDILDMSFVWAYKNPEIFRDLLCLFRLELPTISGVIIAIYDRPR
jgi:hypothetical protein